MALSSAWRSVLPLWLLWSAACSRAASGDDNAFPFDIEGSSAVGRQDPPETSEPRVALGRLPPAAEVQCPCHCHPFRAPAPPPSLSPPISSPHCLESFTWARSVRKLEI
uniref:Laminin subunit alpha 4 n=1 Tax=Mandrillus leucophaeus TaxID=9568 RepID=A0A2K5ZV70_MANLE